jgi:hypothetical protein
VVSSYLHDIGRESAVPGGTHGNISAKLIAEDETLRILFAANDLRSQIELICDYHDRKEISELRGLPENVILDVRPQGHIRIGESVHLRMLGAIFRLADELECISDRMCGIPEKVKDPRNYISAVRIYLEARSIFLEFARDTNREIQESCIRHFNDVLSKLDEFLKPYDLSFKLVDKSPDVTIGPQEEGEEQDILKKEDIAELEEVQETTNPYQEVKDYRIILEKLEETRMKRINSVILQASSKRR